MSPLEYERLVERYLKREISIRTFYKRFNAAFQREQLGIDPLFFNIIDTLGGYLEAYSPSATPEDEIWYRASEESVRKATEIILERLRKYRLENENTEPS